MTDLHYLCHSCLGGSRIYQTIAGTLAYTIPRDRYYVLQKNIGRHCVYEIFHIVLEMCILSDTRIAPLGSADHDANAHPYIK